MNGLFNSNPVQRVEPILQATRNAAAAAAAAEREQEPQPLHRDKRDVGMNDPVQQTICKVKENTTSVWNETVTETVRTIRQGTLVLVTGSKQHTMNATEQVTLLQLPDGWIRKDALEQLCTV
mgnify:CR=1 FL=1